MSSPNFEPAQPSSPLPDDLNRVPSTTSITSPLQTTVSFDTNNASDQEFSRISSSIPRDVVVSPTAASYEGRCAWFTQTLQPPPPLSPSSPSQPYHSSVPPLDPSQVIDRELFSNYVMVYGVPDKNAMRSLAWKILLGYLPADKHRWQTVVREKRRQYQTWLKEFVVNPYEGLDKGDAEANRPPKQEKKRTNNLDNRDDSPSLIITTEKNGANGTKFDDWVAVGPDDDPLNIFALAVTAKSNKQTNDKTNIQSSIQAIDQQKQAETKSKWAQYYLDEEIREEIDKDIVRTYSSLHFFQKPVHLEDEEYFNTVLNDPNHPLHSTIGTSLTSNELAVAKQLEEEEERRKKQQSLLHQLNPLSNTQDTKHESIFGDDDDLDTNLDGNMVKYNDVTTIQIHETIAEPTTSSVHHRPLCHHDVLRRLLFLYAKLNPGVRYVQGMNEILAPIYHVFASDPDYLTVNKGRSLRSKQLGCEHEDGVGSSGLPVQDFSDAEADTFFVFSNLMSEIRDRYIKSLDSSEQGILTIVQRFNALLKVLDYDLWQHLEEINVDPRFYSFRWLTLLLSQDFELPDVLRLWDSLFADPVRIVLHSKDYLMGMPPALPQTLISPQIPGSPPQKDKESHSIFGSLTKKDVTSTTFAYQQLFQKLQPVDPNYRLELYVCCAMLVHLKEELMSSEFTDALYIIHHYPEDKRELDAILALALRLREKHLQMIRNRMLKENNPTTSQQFKKAVSSILPSSNNDNREESAGTRSVQRTPQQSQPSQPPQPPQSSSNSSLLSWFKR